MYNLKLLITLVLVVGVSSSTTPIPTTETPSFSTNPPPPAEDGSPSEELSGSPLHLSASVGHVETPAVIQEVAHDWTDGRIPDTSYTEEINPDDDDKYNVKKVSDELLQEDENGTVEESATTDIKKSNYTHEATPTKEEFKANVPDSLNYDREIIISKDNLVPILKALVLACTGKENPSYTELLKAGAVSAFKTSLKHMGDEKLGVNLLTLAKKLTSNFEREDDEDESTVLLSEMAEEYLSSHKFKLALPESLLLHQEELEEILEQREQMEEEGRSASSDTQLTIFMPRADPGVTTVLSFGPWSWLAALGGIGTLHYYFTGTSPEARIDKHAVVPPQHLRPPRLPLFRNQHHRRDGVKQPPRQQQVDKEFLEYQKNYALWYNQWYLKYKEYYDKNYPYNPQTRAKHQKSKPTPAIAPTPSLRGGSIGRNAHRRKPGSNRPPQQKRRNPAQNIPPQNPRQVVPPSRRRPAIQIVRPNPHLRVPPPIRQPAEDNAAAASIVGTNPNTFGTFQNEGNRGDTHFKVIYGPGSVSSSTVPPTSRVPSPQPVYIPTTESIPTTETGFKPIIKPDSPLSDNVNIKRQTSGSTSPIINEPKPGFRPPKQETVVPKNKPTQTSKAKPIPAAGAHATVGGFKPIPRPKPQAQTTTPRISPVTSSVFKTTAAPTPEAATTPHPAIFFRTATEKSVRVVTSSSFVTEAPKRFPPAPESKKRLPELKRPPRHHESHSLSQELHELAKQPGKSRPGGVEAPARPQVPLDSLAAGNSAGAVRTKQPSHVRIVEHRRPQGFGLGPNPGFGGSTTTSTTTTTSPTTTTPVPIYALDPFYGSRLSRIDVIFHQLKLEDEGCREQVVCNIYKNPEVFTPFSDFLSRQLTVTIDQLRKPKVSDERILRFFRYLKAARDGQDGSECGSKYPVCHLDTTTLSHKPIMSAFQKVSLLMDASTR